MTDDRLLDLAQRLARTLTPGDLDHTLSQITAAAVEALPDTDYASITILHVDGRLETVAPTDDLLWGVDAAQYELREGPCYQAAADSVHITSPDLAHDERFPRYAASAVAAGLYAQAGIQLFDAPKSRGALNLYARQVGAFSDLGGLGELFRHQAAMAIDYAREIHNLQEAVRTRSTIGTAVGIVMERYHLTDERAFAFLARLSQDGNVKLREVARRLIAND
ncbi:ANTAR domain-containing protein [Kribbella capetownensis]|uniref:ANTAR domain-containing protein n=1 Tax=Kribbella capetownensis TaxID=1572659 RepID=A0A4R0JH08_9ACTN|nr:GAF and ANTAR domain-containing protein [Kribbella capetownensis]TCC44006.1 ANTAR domain-containing protein [Kribbella capetownensis]